MLRWLELIERIGRMQGFEDAPTTVNKDFRPNAQDLRGVFTRIGNDDILSAGVVLQEIRDVVHVSVNDDPAIIPAVVLADFVKADELLAAGRLGTW